MIAGSLLIVIASSTACSDPVTDEKKSALGPEKPGVPKGPTHRAGQPCTVCHDGSDQRAFIAAGTVYATVTADKPVQGARVTLTDADGDTFVAETNCAGNFFVRDDSWKPRFPLTTVISYGAQNQKMESVIQRETSCAGCHALQVSSSSPGPVFLWENNPPADAQGGCP